MRGTCSRLGRHRPRTNRYFVEINLDSFLAGRSCTTRHSFSWITREAARPLLASALLRFRRRFNTKVFSAKLSRVYCRKFSILRRAGRFPTTLFRKTEWIPRPFPFSLDIHCPHRAARPTTIGGSEKRQTIRTSTTCASIIGSVLWILYSSGTHL